MACDIRIADPTAKFVASYINIGLTAGDMGSSFFLPREVNLGFAAEYLYTGEVIDAEAAYRTAVQLNPSFGPFHADLANLLRRMNRLDEAARTLEAAAATTACSDGYDGLSGVSIRIVPVSALTAPVEEPRTEQFVIVLFDAPLINRIVLVPTFAETVVLEIVRELLPQFKPSMVTLSAPLRSINGLPATIAPEIVLTPVGVIKTKV